MAYVSFGSLLGDANMCIVSLSDDAGVSHFASQVANVQIDGLLDDAKVSRLHHRWLTLALITSKMMLRLAFCITGG